MDSKIFRWLAGHVTCLYLCSCSISDCYEYFAGRDCSCRELQNLVFEPSPASLLANLRSPRMHGGIAMTKRWFHSDSPRGVTYSAPLLLSYEIDSAELFQDCVEALEQDEFYRKIVNRQARGSMIIAIEVSFRLYRDSDGMRLTEPQPPVNPADVTAITLDHLDPSWGDYVRAAEGYIFGIGMLKGNRDLSSYYTKSAWLRLERMEGNQWRFTADMTLIPRPSHEDLLKKYDLWAESIRFSGTCECDVGTYQSVCIGD